MTTPEQIQVLTMTLHCLDDCLKEWPDSSAIRRAYSIIEQIHAKVVRESHLTKAEAMELMVSKLNEQD